MNNSDSLIDKIAFGFQSLCVKAGEKILCDDYDLASQVIVQDKNEN